MPQLTSSQNKSECNYRDTTTFYATVFYSILLKNCLTRFWLNLFFYVLFLRFLSLKHEIAPKVFFFLFIFCLLFFSFKFFFFFRHSRPFLFTCFYSFHSLHFLLMLTSLLHQHVSLCLTVFFVLPQLLFVASSKALFKIQ